MKKITKPMYAIGLCLLLGINACKKNELPISTTAGESIINVKQVVRLGSTTQRSDNMQSLEPNATVEISEELFNKLSQGANLQMVPISQGRFRAVGVTTEPITIGTSSDPCNWNNVWAAYTAFRNANFPRFQAYANLYCKPFYGGWSKCGFCELFTIYPTTSINCPQSAFGYSPIVGLNATIEL